MGGGKAAEAAYELYAMDWHAWILAGVADTGVIDVLVPPGGIIGATQDALSTALGTTPYALVNVFNPKDSNSRFEALLSEVDNYLAEVSNIEKDTRFTDLSVLRIPSSATHTAKLSAISEAGIKLGYKLNLDAADKIAQINARASAGNSLGHSTRIVAIGKVARKVHQQVGNFLQDAYTEDYKEHRDSIEGGLQFLDISNKHTSSRAIAIGALTDSVDLWSTALRQRSEDELKLAVEDLIWDLKLWDFAGKGLSSISGAAIIPAGAGNENRTLESISTFATAGASIASSV